LKAKTSGRTERRGVALAMSIFESLGFAFREQNESDFGIDAHAELIQSEQPTGQLLGIQLKSGANYLSKRADEAYIFRADQEHVEYWQNHSLPVVICLCDVDAQLIYWQVVNNETAISTRKGFKFRIPVRQKVDAQSLPKLRDLLTPIVSANRYTVFKTEDVSHGVAKRYSFEIVVNGSASKAEIASIVRQMTSEGAKRRYHRNHLVAGKWGDSDAHVVWTYIYASAEDHSRRNHICRSLWICDDLEESFRPSAFHGENIGDNIIVEWSSDYKFLADHFASHMLTKEDYLDQVLPIINELKDLLSKVEELLLTLSQDKISEQDFLSDTKQSRRRIDDIYFQISGMALAPFECHNMDTELMSFITDMHNVVLFFSDKGLQTWDEHGRIIQALQHRSSARKSLGNLEYEIKKIR
jgi:hypothetical protein